MDYEKRMATYTAAGLRTKKVVVTVGGVRDESTFVAMGRDFMIVAPNGDEMFLTSEMLDELNRFRRETECVHSSINVL